MSVRYVVDSRSADRELDRLSEVGFSTVMALETVLATAYAETQQAVHIITGSLKGSGKIESDVDRGVWTGEIIYGGASPGFPFNPVRYAEYEQRRDGGHDFMLPAYAADAAFGTVVDTHVRGGFR